MTDRRETAAAGRMVLIAAVAAVAVMAWLAARNDDWRRAFDLTSAKDDYYNLLVHGLRKGHLAMDAPVDPRLLSSDASVRAQVPDLIDASLYHGRYYLYFGVVPALFLFLPYSLLTGHDLPENGATLLLVVAGFLLYLRTFLDARRRHFPTAAIWAQVACILLLAFGSATPLLLTPGRVYEVAVAGGYCCMAAGWLALARSLEPERNAGGWLALGSLMLGLAVGCRPNYLFALPLLAVVAILVRRSRRPDTDPRAPVGWGRLAAAALIPAGIVGLGLAGYNYGRFGNPLEFGFTYQLTGRSARLAAPGFFWSNLEWYYFRPAHFSPYFPYVFPLHPIARPADYYGQEEIYGQWPILDLAVLTAAWFFSRRRSALAPGLRIQCALVAAGFACLLLSVGFFSFQVDRYMVDFQGSLALALALLGGACAAAASPRRGRWVWRAAFGLLAAGCALYSVLASLQLGGHFARYRLQEYERLAYLGNHPSDFLDRTGLLQQGPVRFQVLFHRVTAPSVRQPLLAAKTPTADDVLYVTQYPDQTIELTLAHEGFGEFRSGLLGAQPEQAYEVEVDLGSLYPPKAHPYFRGWPVKDVERLKTTARVRFNGREVIAGHLPDSNLPSGQVSYGQNPGTTDPRFSGKITAIRRLPPRDPDSLGPSTPSGVWRLAFENPELTPNWGYPLFGTGRAGNGNMLLLQAAAGNKLILGLDQWGAGMTQSPPFGPLGAGPHRLEIFVGPLVAQLNFPGKSRLDPSQLKQAASVMRVWVDGAAVWTTPIQYNLESYDWVSVGSNPQGFSSARPFFVGEIKPVPYSVREMQEFIARNLPAADKR